MADNILEFTVPFDLDVCQQRLDNRHERPRFFAWNWQRRTWVKTRRRDANTCLFTLKRIEKNHWFSVGSLGVVKGYLRHLPNGQTIVLVEQHIAWLWIIMPLIVGAFWLWAMLGISANPGSSEAPVTVLIVMFLALGPGMTGFFWWWAHNQIRMLIGTIKEAFGIWQ